MMSAYSARLLRVLAPVTLVFGGLLVSSASAQAGVQVTCLTQWFAKDFELGHGTTHVRVSQSTIGGWVYNPYLSGGGANTRC